MRRLFWMGVGAVGAVVVAQRVRETARRFAPETVAGQAADAGRRTGVALRDAVGVFRSARADRERDLVTALLAEPSGGTRAERRAARDVREPGLGAVPRDRVGALDEDDQDDFF